MRNYIVSSFAVVLLGLVSCGKSGTDTTLEQYQDSVAYYKKAYEVANYFSIEENENAQRQFLKVGVDNAVKKLQFDLNQLNSREHNPLLPPAEIGERVYMNQAKIINHHWMVLDYYKKNEDDEFIEVGEVFVYYIFHADKPCEFTILDTQIYD